MAERSENVGASPAGAGRPPSARTGVRRHPERGRYDRELIHAILDEAPICHAGFVVDGQPFVIPTIHARVGDTLYLHGSPASRMLRALLLRLPIEEASAKVRTGPPKDDAGDLGLPVWAGVLPLRVTAGRPEPDPGLGPALPVPPSVRGYHRPGRS